MQPLGPFDYMSVPADYRCGKCGAHGCKLWSNGLTLFCAVCAFEILGFPEGSRQRKGAIWIGSAGPAITNHLGEFVTWSSSTDAPKDWWNNLPDHRAEIKSPPEVLKNAPACPSLVALERSVLIARLNEARKMSDEDLREALAVIVKALYSGYGGTHGGL